jgi:sn-glycerol 3-phosphate transport system substrate-binding protein
MKKTLLALLLLLVASLSHAREEIRLWHGMRGPMGAQLDRLVAAFNASQKHYRLEAFFQGPFDEAMVEELRARHARGQAPHIVQVSDEATAEVLESGLVRPLWQVLQEAGRPLDARFLPAVAAGFSDAEGRLLALPFNGSTPVLYYNRAAFRYAGLDPRKPPRTWYEMPGALGALVEAGYPCALTTSSQSWVLVENMSAWHNQWFATPANGRGGSARLAFNNRLMVRWVSMLASWHKSGYFTYAGRDNEAEARFASGECAMLTASSASYAELRKSATLDFAVAPLPYYDDFDEAPQNTLVGGSALWALSGAAPAQTGGVAAFFAYAARADVQADWHQETGDVPLTVAGYDLARKRGYYISNPGHEVPVRQLLRAPRDASKGIRLGRLWRIRGIIDEELETVWHDGKSPLDALNSAVTRGNLLLESVPAASR